MLATGAVLGTVAVILAMVLSAAAMIRHDRAERDRIRDEHEHDRALLAELDRYGR